MRFGKAMVFLLVLMGITLTVSSAPPQPVKQAAEMDVHFSPDEDCIATVAGEIDKAKRLVRLQTPLLESESIAKALLAAVERGVDVQVILSRRHALGEESLASDLAGGEVDVFVDQGEHEPRYNVLVIDLSTVVKGSLLYGKDAESKYADDLLILSDHRPVARQFMANYTKRFKQAVPLSEAKSEAGTVGETIEPALPAGEAVYVTRYGRRYHRRDCTHIRKGAQGVTRKTARQKGRTPCQVCRPDEPK